MESLKILIISISSGALAGWFVYSILKKHTFGELWGAIVTGIIGAYLGFILDTNILQPLAFKLKIDITKPLLGAFLLVLILSKVSPGTHKDRL